MTEKAENQVWHEAPKTKTDQCQGTKANGERCRAKKKKGDFCMMHWPWKCQWTGIWSTKKCKRPAKEGETVCEWHQEQQKADEAASTATARGQEAVEPVPAPYEPSPVKAGPIMGSVRITMEAPADAILLTQAMAYLSRQFNLTSLEVEWRSDDETA